MMKPRIAVFSKQLDNWRSGSGHHLYKVMSRILELNNETPEKDRIDFSFLHYKKCENPIYQQVNELIIPRYPWGSAAVLKKERFDLVHYTPLTFFSPILGVPNKRVATIHGVEQLLIPQFFGPIEMTHERFLVPLYARQMDGIFTVSNTTKNYLAAHFSVDEGKITVAYNGIGSAYKPKKLSDISAITRYDIPTPYIYHVSRFSERKNPWTLLESFALFIKQKNGRPHHLVCAGNGWNTETVTKKAQQLGIADRLITPGFISEADSADLMSGAESFVFPSLAEGFGMPNAEAMAAGCPVITSGAFAIPEIVSDAAIVIDDPKDSAGFANAMARFADNAQLREEYINRGLERIRTGNFSWDYAARSLLNLYMRVLGIDRRF